jgi:hypothetical protein
MSFGALPNDLKYDKMLSNFFITLSSLNGEAISLNLHCSNGGNCLTILPEKVDTIAGAIAFVNVKFVAFLTKFRGKRLHAFTHWICNTNIR